MENYSKKDSIKLPSNKSFGITVGGIFSFLSLLPLLKHNAPNLWMLGLGLALFLSGVTVPSLLTPFNKAWMGLGMILHHVMSPLVLGLLFFVVVAPFSIVMRVFGFKKIGSRNSSAKSNWVMRQGVVDWKKSIRRQF